jgi:alpha-glucosidase
MVQIRITAQDGPVPQVHLPFNFQLVDAPWEARSLATLIADYEAALPPGG